MIDKYFAKPLLWDYSISSLITLLFFVLFYKNILSIPKETYYLSTTSDLSTVSLTSSGFILTLLTVLITFKSGTDSSNESIKNSKSTFEYFFSSSLYFETIKHLKNCIKSLILVSIIGFSLKMGLTNNTRFFLYFYNIFGLIIIVLTLWRCLLILTKILEMQKRDS